MKRAQSVWLVLSACLVICEGKTRCEPSPAPESAKLPVGEEEVIVSAPTVPPTRPAATAIRTGVFAPRERGFALETGLSLRITSTVFTNTTQALLGTLFLGAKRGRVVAGLGIQLSETTLS